MAKFRSGMRGKRSATFDTLRLAWAASPPLAGLTTVLVVVSGFMPVVFMIAMGAVVGAVPAAVRNGFGTPAGNRLVTALAALAGIYVLQSALGSLQGVLTASLGSRFTLALRGTVLDATMSPAGIAHLEDPAVADELDMITSDDQRIYAESTVRNIVSMTDSKLTGLGSFFVLATFRWWAPVLLLGALLLGYRWVRREVKTFYSALETTTPGLRRATYLRQLAVRPEAAKELRIFGLSGWLVDRFSTTWTTSMEALWRDRRGHVGPLLQMTTGELVASGVVFAALAHAAYTGDIGIGALAVFAQATQYIRGLGYTGDAEFGALRGISIVGRLVRLGDKLRTPAADLRGAEPVRGGGTIRFEDVSFAYPNTQRRVLDGLTLEIPPGGSLAIVGLNGAGKTTFTKLLARLYDPDGGRITVDGTDLRDIAPEEWRRRIGVIFQDFVRFELPARANVGFGAVLLQDDDEALARAATKAGASTVLDALPDGWETILSRGYERGLDLSGGQWQKIALARALMAVEGGADVLVLDEPTANLDVRAEAELFERFLEITQDVTTILISHRFSTVRHADRIAVIERGTVIEQGTHDELLAEDGRYAHLYRLQARRFAADDIPAGEEQQHA